MAVVLAHDVGYVFRGVSYENCAGVEHQLVAGSDCCAFYGCADCSCGPLLSLEDVGG